MFYLMNHYLIEEIKKLLANQTIKKKNKQFIKKFNRKKQ